MEFFSAITGIATLVGFFLQIRGLFPDYRRYYSLATFTLLGVTIGFAISGITQTSVSLPSTISPKNIMGFILLGGSGLLIFLCFAASVLTSNQKTSEQASRLGSAVSGFLLFLLIFFYQSFFPTMPDERPLYLTYDEQIELTLSAFERRNFERGVLLASDALKVLPQDDIRRTELEKLIIRIREQQAAMTDSTGP